MKPAVQQDLAENPPSNAPRPRTRWARTLSLARTLPFTISFTVTFLIIAAISGSLYASASRLPWYESVATGLPAFEAGRWWTVLTSPFVLSPPYTYLTALPLIMGGFGWAEWRFGTLHTVIIGFAGHLVGVLCAAAVVAMIAPTGWHWADMLAASYDVGPSCAAFAALTFAIATLPSPWRLRARVAVGLWGLISVLYLGHLYDLEHAITIFAALLAAGLLPAFRHPLGRPTVREWRLLAFWSLIAIGVIQFIDLLVPYDGPLGRNDPAATVWDVVIDLVVIALIANGVRRGYRLAWIVALALGAYNVVSSALFAFTIPALIDRGLLDSPLDVLGQAIAPSVLWLALVLLLIPSRPAFRVRLRGSHRVPAGTALSREELVERLHRFGGGTISWMATWNDNAKIAAGEGAIAYQAHAGVAILLGDPIAGEGRHGAELETFASEAQHAGLVPCAFSANAVTEAAKPRGWRSLLIAEDSIVDLPGLEFKGKPWAAVRTSINRARREGVEFRMTTLDAEQWNILAQVRAISEQWSGDKGLPEMRFTLGTVAEAQDPQTRIGIAVDAEGNLHGVTSWLPVYGPADSATGKPRVIGWTLDLMRRRDGGFGPVMEFLIGSSAKYFSEEGYEFVSLSGAPLVRTDDTVGGPIYQVLDQIAHLIEPMYGFQSLHTFKRKFNPRHEPLYLLYRDEGDLPRIGIAITRAYLPDASMRDLIGAASSAGR